MTVQTLAREGSNQIVEVSASGLWVETDRSRRLGRGPQEVPAWMFNIAWEYLSAHRRLEKRFLLDELNVHRSSLVCAVLAQLPMVEVTSRRPIELALRRATDALAAQSSAHYHRERLE